MTFTSDPPAIDPRLFESGGALALSIEGLTGDAADAQDPKQHNSTHESGGVDSLFVESLDTAGADGEFLAVSGGSLTFDTVEAGVSQSDLDARYDGFFPAVLG
jgi:hypothetical protein